MSQLNVLVLHQMGDPLLRRASVESLEYMVPSCRPDVGCIVHDTKLPFPDFLKDIEYGLIVLGPTFLSQRSDRWEMARLKRDYSFVEQSNACKIALPQDDYDCSAILDNWLIEWGVDRVYPVCPDNWEILYPKSSKNIQFKLGYTGYVSDQLVELWTEPKPFVNRGIDVSYRAVQLGANFGSLGLLKGEIGERFTNALKTQKSKLITDISVDVKDFLPGVEWQAFIENSRFCLTTPSGSSIIDPDGTIRACVEEYLKNNIASTFTEIESHCFPGADKTFSFSCLSPRNIEAALAETVQIATPGPYSGLMLPGEHFIPLDEDCKNISEVLSLMQDKKAVSAIGRRCKESILSEPRLRQKSMVSEIICFAEDTVTARNIVWSNQDEIDKKFARYREEQPAITNRFWQRRRLARRLYATAVSLGGQKSVDALIGRLRSANIRV